MTDILFWPSGIERLQFKLRCERCGHTIYNEEGFLPTCSVCGDRMILYCYPKPVKRKTPVV